MMTRTLGTLLFSATLATSCASPRSGAVVPAPDGFDSADSVSDVEEARGAETDSLPHSEVDQDGAFDTSHDATRGDGPVDIGTGDLDVGIQDMSTIDHADTGAPGPCGLLGVPCPDGFYCKQIPLMDSMQVTREYCQSLTEDAIYVPPGNFWLGTNRVTECQWWYTPELLCDPASGYTFGYRAPIEVTTPPYVMQRKLVTQAEYMQCVDDTPPGCTPNEVKAEWAEFPADFVTWNQAKSYCAWLASTTGGPWRLCSNAEWEKAARGGCETLQPELMSGVACRDAMRAFPWGNGIPPCGFAPADFGSLCNLIKPGNIGLPLVSEDFPASVSPYGALDMHGQSLTSLEDCAHAQAATGSPTDGSAWVEDCLTTGGPSSDWYPPGLTFRMTRGHGGCGNPFDKNDGTCTVSQESEIPENYRQNLHGVRCCRDL